MGVLDYFTVTCNGIGSIGVDYVDLGVDPDESKVYAFVDFKPRLPAGTVIWAPGLTPPRGIQLDKIRARFSPEDGKLRTIIAGPTNEKQVVTVTGSPTGGTFTLTYAGQTTAGIAYNASPPALQSALEALSNIAVGDVYVSGVIANEKQTVTVNGSPAGGSFVLTFNGQTTKPISRTATATDVKTALQNLTNTGSPSVTGPVGGPWVVDFGGSLAGTNVAQMTSAPRSETQTITLTGSPTGGDFALTFSGQTTTPIAYNASTATVQSALEALSNIAPGDVTVTGAPGAWVVAFGGAYANQNVAQLVPFTRNEVQTVTFGGGTGGTFTLTFNGQTTVPIYRFEFAQVVATRLQELSTIGAGNVAVTGGVGGPYIVTFQNGLGRQNVPLMTGSGSAIVPPVSVTAAETSAGIGLTGGTNPTVTVATTVEHAALTGGSSPTISIATTTPGSTGSPFTVSFTGTLADTDVTQMTGSGAGLTPSGGVTVTTAQVGGSAIGVRLVANTAVLDLDELIYDVEFSIPESDRILSPFAILAPTTSGVTVDLASVTKLPPKDLV